MVLHSGNAQSKVACNFLVGKTSSNQMQHFSFTSGQRVLWTNLRLRIKKSAKETSGNLSAACKAAGYYVNQSLTQLVHSCIASDVPTEPCATTANDILALLLKTKRNQCNA